MLKWASLSSIHIHFILFHLPNHHPSRFSVHFVHTLLELWLIKLVLGFVVCSLKYKLKRKKTLKLPAQTHMLLLALSQGYRLKMENKVYTFYYVHLLDSQFFSCVLYTFMMMHTHHSLHTSIFL